MELTFEITTAIITAIVIGLVQAAKQLGLPTKYAPLTAIVLGVACTMVAAFFTASAGIIFTGLVIGLSACGLYSGVKTTAGK